MHKSKTVNLEQKDQFQREGYCIIENVIGTDMLTMLREECACFLGYIDAVMDERATGTIRSAQILDDKKNNMRVANRGRHG